MGSILDALTGWALYAGLVAALGGVLARALIVPRALGRSAAASMHLRRTAGRLALAGALFLLPAMVLFFVRQLAEFRDPFVHWIEDAELLLTGTAWGATWLRGAVGVVLALAALALTARGHEVGWWIGGVVMLALGAFPAFMGHASAAGDWRTLALIADVLHVWAACGWIGGLAFVLLAERSWTGEGSLLSTTVPAFSPVALVCVVLLVLSGSFGAWVHVSGLSALVGSPYGRALLLKLGLAVAVLGLGFVNWRVLTPRLNSAAGQSALPRAALLELVVGQVVLVVTAILVRTPPPMV